MRRHLLDQLLGERAPPRTTRRCRAGPGRRRTGARCPASAALRRTAGGRPGGSRGDRPRRAEGMWCSSRDLDWRWWVRTPGPILPHPVAAGLRTVPSPARDNRPTPHRTGSSPHPPGAARPSVEGMGWPDALGEARRPHRVRAVGQQGAQAGVPPRRRRRRRCRHGGHLRRRPVEPLPHHGDRLRPARDAGGAAAPNPGRPRPRHPCRQPSARHPGRRRLPLRDPGRLSPP